MSLRLSKTLAVTSGIVVASVLVLLGALMIDWGRSAAKVEKDLLIAQAISPDQRCVAEIHSLTTAMHGGPDKVYVTLGRTDFPPGDRIYERTYECDDMSAFHLRWQSAHDLAITYGACNPARKALEGRDQDSYYREQNRVWRSDTAWDDVRVKYEDSGQVAVH